MKKLKLFAGLLVALCMVLWGGALSVVLATTVEPVDSNIVDSNIVDSNIVDAAEAPDFDSSLMSISIDAPDAEWQSRIEVEDGGQYWVQFYLRNDNAESVAEDTAVRIITLSPTTPCMEQGITGIISSARPFMVSCEQQVICYAEHPFVIEPIYQTATITDVANGDERSLDWGDLFRWESQSISDSDKGALVGESLDGSFTGVFAGGPGHDQIVKFAVEVHFYHSFSLQSDTTMLSDDEMMVYTDYQNQDKGQQDNVTLSCSYISESMELVPGSLTLVNEQYPEGIALNEESFSDRSRGVSIGDYAAGAGATISYRVKLTGIDTTVGGDALIVECHVANSYQHNVVEYPSENPAVEEPMEAEVIETADTDVSGHIIGIIIGGGLLVCFIIGATTFFVKVFSNPSKKE